ncbi:hypothetical protein Q7P35_012667 [Cladosporium inversicolor]
MAEEIDLYEVLNIERSASKAEIKKAYHKAALASHPDKVPDEQRAEADEKFKAVSQAYEILSDEQTRDLYDEHGMAAFEKGGGMGGGAGPDLDDILAQMFGGMGGGMGGGFEGMHGSFGGGGPGGPRQKSARRAGPRCSSMRFRWRNSTRARRRSSLARRMFCARIATAAEQTRMRPVGPGLVTQETINCSTCAGRGKFYADKDKCKRCKGERTIKQKKILELYIPPGSREGEKIVLAGEADHDPDDEEAGDIIFELVEEPHAIFHRAGADLQAEIDISLAEALTGFNRTVVRHLDGRGIALNIVQPAGQVLRPDQVLKVPGEGMPVKRSDHKGDLYLVVNVKFPEDGWLKDDAAVQKVRDVLPKAEVKEAKPGETPEIVDEVEFETVTNLDGFGAGSDDPRGGGEWEDEDDEGPGGAQCAQQ